MSDRDPTIAWCGPPVWLHGDLLPGNLLAASGRLAADEATRLRGRGCALALAVLAPEYCLATNPGFAALARRMIAGVLTDYPAMSK